MSVNGFSFFHNEGGRGQILEAILSLTVALVVIDVAIQSTSHTFGSRAAKSLHVALAMLFACLCISDLALAVGAGGARVSLPLVLFALTECGYVPRPSFIFPNVTYKVTYWKSIYLTVAVYLYKLLFLSYFYMSVRDSKSLRSSAWCAHGCTTWP